MLSVAFHCVGIIAMEDMPLDKEAPAWQNEKLMSKENSKELDSYQKLARKNELVEQEAKKKSLYAKMYESTDPSIIALGLLHTFFGGYVCYVYYNS